MRPLCHGAQVMAMAMRQRLVPGAQLLATPSDPRHETQATIMPQCPHQPPATAHRSARAVAVPGDQIDG